MKVPQWISDLSKEEQDALQAAVVKYRKASNRKYLKRK